MSSDFITNAGNFMGSLQTGVDPRTGQYFINFPFLQCSTNRLLGPGVELALNYSALSGADRFGFGKGVSISGISFIDRKEHQLTLSSGETWVLGGGGQVLHRHLKDCLVKSEGAAGWTIRWKNGVQENLRKVGPDCYLTSEIVAPSGKRVTLSWMWNGRAALLRRISDDEGLCLCQIDYKGGAAAGSLIIGSGATLTVWPGKKESYSIGLFFQNGFLGGLSREVGGGGSPATKWLIGYRSVSGRTVPDRLDHPTGMVEKIVYGNQLQFPAGGLTVPFPAVSRYSRHYGRGQPDSVRTYSYTEKNFLGNQADRSKFGSWKADNDYLGKVLVSDYVYGSVETLHNEDGKAQITRHYNNYHFLISEEYVQGQCRTVRETEYAARYNTDIDSQPAHYSLPLRQSLIYKHAGLSRTETTTTTFDDFGNPLITHHPDGTVESCAWYPAQGEPGQCPAEPSGFVRFLKHKAVKPPLLNGYDVPGSLEKYVYKRLGGTDCIVQTSCMRSSELDGVYTRLTHQETFYVEEPDDVDFGRVRQVRSTLYAPTDETLSYMSVQDITTVLNPRTQIATQTIKYTSHDGLVTKGVREISALGGQILKEVDARGVVTDYIYDGMGRIKNLIHAAGSAYSNQKTWLYSIEDGYPVTIEEDSLGNRTRSLFDGGGRLVRSDVYDRDISSNWHTISQLHYNSLGQILRREVMDWTQADRKAENAEPSVRQETTYLYDGWGAPSHLFNLDGTCEVAEYDPIALTHTSYRTRTEDGMLLSGKKTVFFDKVSLQPVETCISSIDGELAAWSSQEWDGLRRKRKQTDVDGQITSWDYDVHGRVISQTLPDGSVIEQVYPSHLTTSQAREISVRETHDAESVIIGQRSFDGFGRVTENLCGGRQTKYSYESSAHPFPSVTMLPEGNSLEWQYVAEIGSSPERLVVKNRNREQTDSKQIEYDRLTYQPLSYSEGSFSCHTRYTAAGQLKEEKLRYGESQHSVSYVFTLGGVPERFTLPDQNAVHYVRDNLGRITQIHSQDVVAHLDYDASGRLAQRKVVGLAPSGKNELNTYLSHDEFDREISRTITASDGKSITISQTWLKNGLLDTRTIHRKGDLIKSECYKYDCRKRLVEYTTEGDAAVQGGERRMSGETYKYDARNNLLEVVTTYTDSSFDTATYHYNNSSDTNQLTSIDYTIDTYCETVTFEYDSAGRMLKDQRGNRLTYDAQGRLSQVHGHAGSSWYEYDAIDRLCAQKLNEEEKKLFFYLGEELTGERIGEVSRTYIKAGHNCLAIREDDTITLIGTDHNDSILYSQKDSRGHLHSRTPYGEGKNPDNIPGFNGEPADPVNGVYHLGNGYRAYNPVLRRFHCPDSLSPFGAGGINPYSYCAGDPVNLTDPSGHISGAAIAGIALGTIGVAMALWTAGSSIVAAGGIIAAMNAATTVALVAGTVGLAADVTGIVSAAIEETDPQASATLGWISLGLGIVGAGATASPMITKLARRISTRSGGQLDLPMQAIGAGLRGNAADEILRPAIAPKGSYGYFSSFQTIDGLRNEALMAGNIQGALTGLTPFGEWTFGLSKSVKGVENLFMMNFGHIEQLMRRPNNVTQFTHHRVYRLNYSGMQHIAISNSAEAIQRRTLQAWGVENVDQMLGIANATQTSLVSGPVRADGITQVGGIYWMGPGRVRTLIQ